MIKFQFSYCFLIWMFSSRKSNNLINKIHEAGILKLYFKIIKMSQSTKEIYKFYWLKFIKLTKVKHQVLWKTYLCFGKTFIILEIIANENKKKSCGLETICYRTPHLWASLPEEYKHQNSEVKFEESIKNWKYETWIWLLCALMDKI